MYPKTIAENMEYRNKLLWTCNKDASQCAAVKRLYEQDVLFAFNVIYWTHDPRRVDIKDVPFITWGFQDEFILGLVKAITEGKIDNREDVFIDKSRDMGATWCVLGVMYWLWSTRGGMSFRLGSRLEDLIDKPGIMDTLFEKVRFLARKTPLFLQPAGFDFRKHSSFMRMVNPENQSVFVGEAANSAFGKAGRSNACLFDEFAEWSKDDEAWRSATDTTPCKISLGTPKGMAGKFAELSRTDECKNKYNLLWYRHPSKIGVGEKHLALVKEGKFYDKAHGYIVEMGNQDRAISGTYVDQMGRLRSEWYDKQCNSRDEKDVKENIDCDYLTAGNPVFNTEICRMRLTECTRPIKGNLVWKVRPVFNSYGYCDNQNQLEVRFLENPNGLYSVWEMPVDGWLDGYCIGADVALGLEQGDWNSARVRRRFILNGRKPQHVCSLRCKLKTFEYSEELAKLAVWYKYCCVAIENNSMGQAVIDQIYDLYPYLYHADILTKGKPEKSDRIGWLTNSKTKAPIITHLGQCIQDREFEDYDEVFWGETLTFVNDDSVMEAQGKSRGQKCYDDTILSTAILNWIDTQLPLPRPIRQVDAITSYDEWMEKRIFLPKLKPIHRINSISL